MLFRSKPENAIWHSYFAYRTVRMLERNKQLDKDDRKRWQAELAEEIANAGIIRHGGNYRVALFCHLYQQRLSRRGRRSHGGNDAYGGSDAYVATNNLKINNL